MPVLCVCIGSSCHLNGAYNIIQSFQKLIEEHNLHGKLDFKSQFCVRQCGEFGVTVTLNEESHRILPETARAFFLEHVLPTVKE